MKTSTYQTDAPSTSLWNLSLTSQQRWPVMCSVNCNKTIKLVLSPHAKSDRTAYEIWKALSAGVTELDVLFLLDICWTFHSHTLNPHSDQVFTLNPSFINAQVDLTYSAVWGCGCIYESLTCGGKLTFFCVCVWDGFFFLNSCLWYLRLQFKSSWRYIVFMSLCPVYEAERSCCDSVFTDSVKKCVCVRDRGCERHLAPFLVSQKGQSYCLSQG